MTRLRMIEFVAPGVEAIAEALGLFEEQGLEIEVIHPRSANEKRRILMGGDGDAALTAIDNAIAWDAGGDDLRLVAQVERTTVLDLIAQPDVGSLADLRGRALTVDAVDTGFAIVLRKLLADNGIGLDEYELLATGNIDERYRALVAGRAAAGLLGAPWNVRAMDEGLRSLTTIEDAFPTFPGIGLLVRESRMDELRDVLERYMTALQTALDWSAEAGPSATAARLAEAGVDRRSAEALVGVWPATLEPSRAGVGLLYEIRRDIGALPGGAPAIDELIVPLSRATLDG